MRLCRGVSAKAAGAIAACLLAVALAVWPADVRAQDAAGPADDPYTVSDVDVNVEAADRAAARDQAFAQGQRQALATLLERLGVAGQVSIDSISAAEQANLLLSMRVQEERTAPGQYIGRLAFRFRPEAVRALFRDRGIAYVEPSADVAAVTADDEPAPESEPEAEPQEPAVVQTDAVLVVPVWRDGVMVRLWDDPNPWLATWSDFEADDDLPAFQVPYGDLEDVAGLTPQQALFVDGPAIAGMVQRYGAAGAVVALAEPGSDAVSVTLFRPETGADAGERFSIAGDPADRDVLEEAARGVLRRLAGTVAEPERESAAGPVPQLQPIGAGTAGTRMPVRVMLRRPQDWFDIRGLLATNPLVSGASVRRLSADVVEIEIAYVGSELELAQSLSEQGLVLTSGAVGSQLQLAR
ncbi:MAG: hypothetical protein H6842_08535 [Rhodospirillaceae bacterium]|nr:hypothetical protein [Rhodospirillaceae bacterium]